MQQKTYNYKKWSVFLLSTFNNEYQLNMVEVLPCFSVYRSLEHKSYGVSIAWIMWEVIINYTK
ncbi:MAG: hypothetical protein WCH09_08250 [Bacteroidota bacterium]